MERIGRFALLLFLLAAPVWAQRQMTVAELQRFIKSSIELKQSDKQVADFLKNVKLTQKLDARTVEDLQGVGAGPRTVEVMRTLMTATANLPDPPPLVATPPAARRPDPSPAEQERILKAITENAINYSAGLPDFICTQVTRRHIDPYGNGAWRTADVIQEQLSFVDHKEDYRVVLINNLPVTTVKHNQLGGTTSSGEFGSMLEQIFKPASKTEFEWDHWATLRGKRTYVYTFHVLQKNSEYSIFDEESGRGMIAGYNGLIYADEQTKQVMRIKLDLEGLENFPIRKVSLDLNYDFVEISGVPFVLPLKAELNSSNGRFGSRNEVEFRMYQKFSADAKIVYDIPDEIPKDQLEEKPIR